MQCPLCVDESLNPHLRGGVEIDVCPRCRGVWLDRGELDKLVDDAPPPASEATVGGPASPPRGDARSPKKQKRRRLADRLGDVLEDVLDI